MTAYETTTTRLAQQELGACALIQDLLPLYLEGEVNTTSRDLIVEHLARCERCAGYLAGAQTTRVQLRRAAAQRSEAVQRDEPAQQSLSNGQRITQLIAAFTICIIGAMDVVLTAHALENEWNSPIAGIFIGCVCLFALCSVAYQTIGWHVWRWVVLLGGCGAGAIATMLFVLSLRAENPVAMFMMFSLGITSFIGVALAMQWRVSSRI